MGNKQHQNNYSKIRLTIQGLLFTALQPWKTAPSPRSPQGLAKKKGKGQRVKVSTDPEKPAVQLWVGIPCELHHNVPRRVETCRNPNPNQNSFQPWIVWGFTKVMLAFPWCHLTLSSADTFSLCPPVQLLPDQAGCPAQMLKIHGCFD